MLKSSLLFFATALLVIVCLPMAGRNPQAASPAPAQSAAPAPAPSGKNPVKPTAESQAHAKMLFTRDCALCHGDNGNGKTDVATSMNLTLDDWTNPNTLANKLDSELFATIRNGKNQMPPEDVGRANDTEVWNLIIYIRALPKARPPAPAPAPAPDSTPAPAPSPN
jgi:mono/diheme cytochrome c family protein